MKSHEKLAILAIVAGAVSTPVFAQDLRSASENVVACQSVEDTAERLACFEAAAQQLSTALAVPPPQIVQAPPATSSAAAVSAPVQQATTSTGAPVQQASTETTEPPSNGSILPSWLPRVSFGTQRDVEQEPDEFETQLTRIQRNKLGRHFFTTAEGHVWRQMQIEDIKAPSTLPSNVILYKNWTGSIKIKILETNRSYSVLRVE